MLLERKSTVLCGTRTVGALIEAFGRDMLWSDRVSESVDVIVIHYMSDVMRNSEHPYVLENIIGIFAEYGVSAHYVIDRAGLVYRCVPEEKKAWHAGGSIMPEPDNRSGVNDFSIGIELLATHDSGFTVLQYDALAELCRTIESTRQRTMTYVGHDRISGARAVALGLRSDEKPDPGPLFDWGWFFRSLRLQ